jgi:hypothetical protein
VAHPAVAGLGRTRIKRSFGAPKATFEHWYPPNWGLTTNLASP